MDYSYHANPYNCLTDPFMNYFILKYGCYMKVSVCVVMSGKCTCQRWCVNMSVCAFMRVTSCLHAEKINKGWSQHTYTQKQTQTLKHRFNFSKLRALYNTNIHIRIQHSFTNIHRRCKAITMETKGLASNEVDLRTSSVQGESRIHWMWVLLFPWLLPCISCECS